MKIVMSFIALNILSLSQPAIATEAKPEENKNLCVYATADEMRVALHGTSAVALFDFLNAPTTEESINSATQTVTRKGEGILCMQKINKETRCLQSLKADGSSSLGLGPLDPLDSLPYAELRFKGAKAKKLYDFLQGSVDRMDLVDGGTKIIHLGARMTCSLVERNGTSTYACNQTMTSDGFAWGDGTDPIVNVGTRGVVLEFADPASASDSEIIQ